MDKKIKVAKAGKYTLTIFENEQKELYATVRGLKGCIITGKTQQEIIDAALPAIKAFKVPAAPLEQKNCVVCGMLVWGDNNKAPICLHHTKEESEEAYIETKTRLDALSAIRTK